MQELVQLANAATLKSNQTSLRNVFVYEIFYIIDII